MKRHCTHPSGAAACSAAPLAEALAEGPTQASCVAMSATSSIRDVNGALQTDLGRGTKAVRVNGSYLEVSGAGGRDGGRGMATGAAAWLVLRRKG